MTSAAPSLEGRVALVTGASRGIGRAIARGLAARGGIISAVARSEQEIASLTDEIGGAGIVISLATEEGCAHAVAETQRLLGPISILVNNAGADSYDERSIWEQPTRVWRQTMAVNLDAPFWLTRASAVDMLKQRWGRIIMISSTAGQVGAPTMSAFCASKHGLLGLMRAAAADLIPFGVTCNAVLPGWVKTEMSDHGAQLEAAARGTDAETVWAERAASYAAGRVVEPDEVARIVAFLATEEASAINGEAITVALGSLW